MVKLVKKELINEAKQVGNLYHVCTLDAFVNYIIPDNELRASGKYYNQLLDTKEAISFTRDPLFVVPTETVMNSGILFQFVIDGNKLSEKYKVIPYNGNKGNPRYREKEEVVVGPIKNFKSYIKKVGFDIKNIYYFTNSTEVLSKLRQVKSYLDPILCKRIDLPFLQEDDWSVLFTKTKNKFQIDTLDDLIEVLETRDSRDKLLDHLFDKIDTIDLFFNNIHSYSYDEIDKLLKEHPAWRKKLDLLFPSLLSYDGERDLDLASFFVKKGYIDINQVDKDGNTYLSRVCEDGDIDNIYFFLDHGADVNQKNKDGITPLMNFILSKPSNDLMIDTLISYGAKINEQDKQGNTALHYAVIHDCPMVVVKSLLNNGADKNIRNNSGMLPMDYAN